MTTYSQFIAGLSSLAVSGVTAVFPHPPEALNTADLPAMWVQLPRGQDAPLTFQANGGWPTLRADLVVAIAPVAQGIQAENFAATVAMMDAVADALQNADICRGLAGPGLSART